MTQSTLLFKQWLLGNNFGISLTVLWLFCYCHFLNLTLKPALIVQIHWDFTISTVHTLLLKDRETLFWFHKCPQKFISPPQTTKTFIGQFMIASHAGLFREARISSLPTNACSTENNIPVPSTIVQSTIVKKSVDRLNMTHKLVVV